MQWIAAYLSVLVVFGAIDIVWLSVMGSALYKPILGDLLAPKVRIAPAVAFYLIYPLGLTILAVAPALREGSLGKGLFLGTVAGALAYATYDLTNHATLRHWSLQITLADIAYGAIASAIAAVAAVFIVQTVLGLGSGS
jgi:uncharacterized membrane protein